MNLDDRFALSLDELDMVQGGQGKCFGGSSVSPAATTSLKGGCGGQGSFALGGSGWGGGFEEPSAQWGSSFGAVDPAASMNGCNQGGWSDPSFASSGVPNGTADWGNAFGASDASSSSAYGGGSFAADSASSGWGGGGGGWGGGSGSGCW